MADDERGLCPRCGAICDALDCECDDSCLFVQWAQEHETAGTQN